MKFADIQAVIVDLDGTMVDTLGDFEVALNRTMADLGLPGVDRAAIERTVGKGSEHLIRSLLAEQLRRPEVIGCGEACPALSVDALYERAWRQYQHHYLSINGQFADVFAGVEDSLRALQGRGLAMACLTNKPLAFAQGLLAVKGLAGYFSRVFGGDSFERKKPDPLPLLKTCEALGTLPAQTLMVGDSENDALAARAAGCPVVLVSYGYNHGRPVSSVDADAWVDSMLELV
ncbi:phosphoglycolate phosphatase [Hydrogenophaga sp.]|uniref:phosphoglycolate phosphatase n=1 Tax=Hydrogenophaga sp. TaxID=1904254 RepID=UPI0008BD5102|nr:phosphoglycolate phosphatase [Hydrogenophaga sp.]OGA74194.1 MAG: phosphoglycolate phosphatase [Burkholderiales bacterium GWE1_65_30]OGA89549.1 MAG: phosphoglycolate phosphatase [Burkholderiales bacterium GWF1_66_17]